MDIMGRLTRRTRKTLRAAKGVALTAALTARNLTSRSSLLDSTSDVDVSLTSFGRRMGTVHLTIESISRGKSLPLRLVLWTDPGVAEGELSPGLKRLMRRGLEVRSSPEQFGPHTKYFPHLLATSTPRSHALVTADDDTLYPRTWLLRLSLEHQKTPTTIVCFRAHQVMVDRDSIAPYNSWRPVRTTEASRLHFATGVSGVIYPAAFLDALAADGDGFLGRCPRADDVWLHARAVAHNYTVRQITSRPVQFPEIARTQRVALHRTNTGQSLNDEQIRATYDRDLVRALAASWNSPNAGV